MLSRMPFDTVEREDTPVIYVAWPGKPEDIPSAAQRAWQDLEALVPIQGRKAYGYWYPPAKPWLELNRRHDEVDVLIPIQD